MSSYVKEKIIKAISQNYTFLPAILGRSENLQTNAYFVDAYCVILEPRVKLLLVATRPYSAMLDAFAVITALTKCPEKNFQLTVGHYKFNFLPN